MTLDEVAAPLDGLLRPVPPVRPGICSVCHHVPKAGFDTCWSCSETTGQVSRPVDHVVPITVYETGGQVWHHLRNYKDVERNPTVRDQLLIPLLAVLTRFLQQHGEHVAPRGWDVITCVPSTKRPEQPHPLLHGMARVGSLKPVVSNLLGPGDVELAHNQASDGGYRVLVSSTDRVLLVDDTFTTGARLQSAASALSLAGYDVTGAVVLGRVYRPDFSDAHRAVWDACTQRPFSPLTCTVCDVPW